jgi:hypothetical protein
LIELPQEYWRTKILFEIASGVGAPLAIDDATKNRIFDHYSRILVDMDLSERIYKNKLLECDGFSFYVQVVMRSIFSKKKKLVILSTGASKSMMT